MVIAAFSYVEVNAASSSSSSEEELSGRKRSRSPSRKSSENLLKRQRNSSPTSPRQGQKRKKTKFSSLGMDLIRENVMNRLDAKELAALRGSDKASRQAVQEYMEFKINQARKDPTKWKQLLPQLSPNELKELNPCLLVTFSWMQMNQGNLTPFEDYDKCCNVNGVFCHENGAVEYIYWYSKGLVGPIPWQLAYLKELKDLYLLSFHNIK
jgi:hypothetical protein